MKRRLFIGQSVAAAAGMSVFPAPALAQPGIVRFGLTPVFLSNDLALLNGLKDYLARATGYDVELVQKRTYQEITTLLVAGQLDAAWICGYPYIRFQSSLELMSIPVWQGRPEYQAYLIAAAGRSASQIEELRGDLHCFSDPDSNSGFLVTTALLADRETRPNDFFRKSFFAYGHRNVVRAVASQLAQSGSVDGYVWDVLSRIEPALTRKTKVIWKSDWLGFPPLAAPKETAGTPKFKALQQAFTRMHMDPLGQKVLNLLQLERFGNPNGSDYAKIVAMIRKVQAFG